MSAVRKVKNFRDQNSKSVKLEIEIFPSCTEMKITFVQRWLKVFIIHHEKHFKGRKILRYEKFVFFKRVKAWVGVKMRF